MTVKTELDLTKKHNLQKLNEYNKIKIENLYKNITKKSNKIKKLRNKHKVKPRSRKKTQNNNENKN